MYNGIGLNTPRGSGTNGYVQTNAACVRTRKDPIQYLKDDHFQGGGPAVYREPNADLVEHERKRQIEIKCLELRERLEEEDKYSEELIEKKVCELRKSLLTEVESGKKALLSKDQVRVKLLEEKQKKLRDALGLTSDKEAQSRGTEKPKPARARDQVPSSGEEEEEGKSSSDDSVSSLSSSSDSEEEKKRKQAKHKKMKRRQRDPSDERRPISKRSRRVEEQERSSHKRSRRDHRERHTHSRRS